MVESVDVSDSGHVTVTILLTIAGCPLKSKLTTDTTEALQQVPGVTGVEVRLGVMSDEQRADLRTKLRGGVAEKEIPFAKPGSLTRVYAVASGRVAWASPRSPPTWPPRCPRRACASVSWTPTSMASPSPHARRRAQAHSGR